MFFIFLVGLALGGVGALYFLYLVRTSKKNKKDQIDGALIYLNFLLLNKREVVIDTVEAKLTSRFGSGSTTKKLASKLGKIAAKRIPDSAVTDKIGDAITAILPVKLSEMGINGEARIAFQKGPYFVAIVHVRGAEVEKVIAKSAGKEKAGKFGMLMEMIGTQGVLESVENSMVQVIAGKLSDILPIKLRDQFASKGLEVTITAKTEPDQAKYMFAMLQSLEPKTDTSSSSS